MSIKVAFKVDIMATVVSPPDLYGKAIVIVACLKESDRKSGQLKLSCNIDKLIPDWILMQGIPRKKKKEENSRDPALLATGASVKSSVKTC
jgi:hypothetical protein